MIDLGRWNVLGIHINAVDYEAALEQFLRAAHERRSLGVSALAVHGLMLGVLDPVHRYRLNQLELVVPDGQPVRWGLNWLHRTKLKERVYGPHLMLATCERAAQEEIPIYLYGGTDALLEALSSRLEQKYPQLMIAGRRASAFRQLSLQEEEERVEEIRASGAAITLVGLGCPRQEVWAFELRERLSMPVLAVGAAFNFHAGVLPQAPALLQRNGLEWLFRFSKEPVRLWKRYVLLNPLYLTLLLCQRTRIASFVPGSSKPPAERLRYG